MTHAQIDIHTTYFERVFDFTNDSWALPSKAFNANKFIITELQDMKHCLNEAKSELNNFDLLKWSHHTKQRDIAGYVMPVLRKTIHPELLTQAWCKFYEIISKFSMLSHCTSDYLRSLHLCEAPGAFVCALNHYIVLHYPNKRWYWLANTLNPYYEGNALSEMIPDDRLIDHTAENWLFGLDKTGNIQHYYNHCHIVEKAEYKVDLVTADGSIDCMKDPGEQERLVEFLQYCETFTALKCLKEGGTFVLKIFTIFEDSTICLLYMLNCFFDKVSLFKPCTSKSGNSELYVVCIGFYSIEIAKNIWNDLIQPYKSGGFVNNTSMFALKDIPESFLTQTFTCCQYFFIERQIPTIRNNVHYFYHSEESELKELHYLKTHIASYYRKKYGLKSIPKSRRIVSYTNVHEKKRKLSNFDCITNVFNNSLSLNETDLREYLNIMHGLRIEYVHTSKFASVEDLNKLMTYTKNKRSTSSLYELLVEYLKKKYVVINVRDFDLIPYYKFQKDLFLQLSLAIKQRKNIFLLNIPFHTYFLAGLWSVLATGFNKIYFGIGWILFFEPVSKFNQVFDICDKIMESYKTVDSSQFPSDIIQIFSPNIFNSHLDLVVSALTICNQFSIPL